MGLVQVLRFGPSRELGDGVKLSEQPVHELAGIVALAELVELAHDPRQRFFGLGNGDVRVVLALLLETAVMLEKFFAEKVCEAGANRHTGRFET